MYRTVLPSLVKSRRNRYDIEMCRLRETCELLNLTFLKPIMVGRHVRCEVRKL